MLSFIVDAQKHDQTGCLHGGAASRVRGEPSPSFLFVMPPHLSLLSSSSSSCFHVAAHSGGTLQCHSKWPPSNFWQHSRGQTGAPCSSSQLTPPFFFGSMFFVLFFPPLITAVTGVWSPFFHLFQSVCSLVSFLYCSLLLHHRIFILLLVFILFNLLLVFFPYFQSIYLSIACLIKKISHCCIIIILIRLIMYI